MSASNCRLCGGKLFTEPIFELEGMPKAAQYYPTEEEFAEDKGIRLNIYQCEDCGLVQADIEPVDYFKEVITAASFSEKTVAYRLGQMNELVERFNLKGKKALEIGCAKGDMLDVLQTAGMRATGIEGSLGSVEIGRAKNRNLIHGYIGEQEQIEGGPYDFFVCLNYLEHVPDPGKIIKIIYNNTTPDAVGFVTVPNLGYLLESKCFYEFLADHLSYFTEKTLTHAFESNGFDVLDCGLINNDNDVVVVVQKKQRLQLAGQYSEVTALIEKLQQLTQEYKAQNKKVAVWGAGHRTLALLALADLTDIAFVVDSAPFKQGKFTPVTHLDIVPPDRLKQGDIDLILVMVPGIYPEEVYKTLVKMELTAKIALQKGNDIEFK